MNFKIVLIVMSLFNISSDSFKIDLGAASENKNWSIVNDGVMGGLSRGQINYEEESLTFSGKLSLENNGGFSWLKGPKTEIDLSKFAHVRLKIRGEGRDYDLTFEDNTGYSALYFKHTFPTEKSVWTTIELPLSDFKQKYFGRMTGKSLDESATIRRVGILMNDKNTGAFQIEVDYIEFF